MCAVFFRAMTSVSWVHQRQRTLTGSFAVSWEPFTCSVKLSTQLRSSPFTSLAQDTRYTYYHIMYHTVYILCTPYSASMSCTIWQVEYPGNLKIALSMLLTAVFARLLCQLEVVETINHSLTINHKRIACTLVPGCPCGIVRFLLSVNVNWTLKCIKSSYTVVACMCPLFLTILQVYREKFCAGEVEVIKMENTALHS